MQTMTTTEYLDRKLKEANAAEARGDRNGATFIKESVRPGKLAFTAHIDNVRLEELWGRVNFQREE